jgi:hypothetical protein
LKKRKFGVSREGREEKSKEKVFFPRRLRALRAKYANLTVVADET